MPAATQTINFIPPLALQTQIGSVPNQITTPKVVVGGFQFMTDANGNLKIVPAPL